MKNIFKALLFLTLSNVCLAQKSGLSEADRDFFNQKFEAIDKRFVAVETQIVVLNTNMENSKYQMERDRENSDKNADRIFSLITALIVSILGMVGFIWWDRRNMLAPIQDENRKLRFIIEEYSKKQPELAEIVRIAGVRFA